MGLSAILTLGVPLVAKLVDKLMGGGNGPSKKATAIEIVKAIIARFASPGVGLPGEAEIGDLLQNAVDALNKAGELQGASTTIDATGVDVQLLAIGKDLIARGTELIQRSGANKGAS